jgi:hypothetical protein
LTCSVTIVTNGLLFHPLITFPITDTQGHDCFADPTDLSRLPKWGPGTYSFSAFSGDSEIAQGILVVLALP